MAGLEENIENAIQRRNIDGGIDHNLIRGLILRDIFNPVREAEPVPIFNLEEMDAQEVEMNFRFVKEDILRLVRLLRIPEVIRTRSGHLATGKLTCKDYGILVVN